MRVFNMNRGRYYNPTIVNGMIGDPVDFFKEYRQQYDGILWDIMVYLVGCMELGLALPTLKSKLRWD